MTNNKAVEALELTLASSYALMLKTQNYHWNVVGPSFKSLHELFQLQYEDLFIAIDDLAERIRILGSKVDGNFENFAKLNSAKKADHNLDSVGMVSDLVADNEAMVRVLKEGVKAAQGDEDEATTDMLIGRTQIHEKAIWMLRSSI
jgi:starvation-inducible DNA-binding protein